MDIVKKGNNLTIKVKLKKNEVYKISQNKHFRGVSIFKQTQLCQGYSSKTEDNHHIILLDWDDTYKDVVLADIKHIQKLFHLPPAYLFTTREIRKDRRILGNYHAVILSKHTAREVFHMQGETNIDANFRDSPIRKASNSWVLRTGNKKGSGKIKFLEIIGENNLTTLVISSAHKKLLSKFFKIKHPKYQLEDMSTKLNLQIYETKG